MCLRFVFLLITRTATWLRLSRREETWRIAEILILRQQLAVLQRRQPCRPKLNWADRALLATLLGLIPRARRHRLRLLVTPDTIVRWHRLCPGRDRARHQAHPHPRSHPASHRGMDRPAGPKPDHGPRRAGTPGQVHDPRPRLELHRSIRRGPRRCRDPDRALQRADAAHERDSRNAGSADAGASKRSTTISTGRTARCTRLPR